MEQTHARLRIESGGGFETRDVATIALLRQINASKVCPSTIWIDDSPQCTESVNFAYSTPIPAFLFNNWPEVGIDDYESIVRAMRLASLRPPRQKGVLGLIGNPKTNAMRAKAVRRTQSWTLGKSTPKFTQAAHERMLDAGLCLSNSKLLNGTFSSI